MMLFQKSVFLVAFAIEKSDIKYSSISIVKKMKNDICNRVLCNEPE